MGILIQGVIDGDEASKMMIEDPHELFVVIQKCVCARPSPFQTCQFLVCPFNARHSAPIMVRTERQVAAQPQDEKEAE